MTRVKYRYQDRPALPRSIARAYIKHMCRCMLIIIALGYFILLYLTPLILFYLLSTKGTP